MLYELLTGRCPIVGSDPASYLAGHVLRPPLDFVESDPEGRVPPAARQVIFQPAIRDGIPGKMWTELIFEFAE